MQVRGCANEPKAVKVAGGNDGVAATASAIEALPEGVVANEPCNLLHRLLVAQRAAEAKLLWHHPISLAHGDLPAGSAHGGVPVAPPVADSTPEPHVAKVLNTARIRVAGGSQPVAASSGSSNTTSESQPVPASASNSDISSGSQPAPASVGGSSPSTRFVPLPPKSLGPVLSLEEAARLGGDCPMDKLRDALSRLPQGRNRRRELYGLLNVRILPTPSAEDRSAFEESAARAASLAAVDSSEAATLQLAIEESSTQAVVAESSAAKEAADLQQALNESMTHVASPADAPSEDEAELLLQQAIKESLAHSRKREATALQEEAALASTKAAEADAKLSVQATELPGANSSHVPWKGILPGANSSHMPWEGIIRGGDVNGGTLAEASYLRAPSLEKERRIVVWKSPGSEPEAVKVNNTANTETAKSEATTLQKTQGRSTSSNRKRLAALSNLPLLRTARGAPLKRAAELAPSTPSAVANTKRREIDASAVLASTLATDSIGGSSNPSPIETNPPVTAAFLTSNITEPERLPPADRKLMSFVEVPRAVLTIDQLKNILRDASFIVERAGTATSKGAIELLKSEKYNRLRATTAPLGSVSQATLLERLRCGSRENSFIMDECQADSQQPVGIFRTQDDPICTLVQQSKMLQAMWVGRGEHQPNGGLVDAEQTKGSQLVAFVKHPHTATPMHADHQSFESHGVDCFCPAVGMVLQVVQPTSADDAACKRVLVIAKQYFERARTVLKLQPHLNPSKQDPSWPGCKEYDFETRAKQRWQSIVDTLTEHEIEYTQITLYHGDRYAAH